MMKDQNVRIAAAFIIGILVGVGGYWLATHRTDTLSERDTLAKVDLENDGTITPLTETEDTASKVAETPGIRVEGQNPGKKVIITQVLLEKPAWVVIRDNVDGKPGNILGARLFDKGRTSGVVELLRGTVAGKTYTAMIYSYANVKRQFDSKLDVPLKGANGEPVMTTFAVSKVTE